MVNRDQIQDIFEMLKDDDLNDKEGITVIQAKSSPNVREGMETPYFCTLLFQVLRDPLARKTISCFLI